MLLLPESSLIKSPILPAYTHNPKVLQISSSIHLQFFSPTLSFSPNPIQLYTYPPSASQIAMPVQEFVIGIETEGFWKGKTGSKLPGDNVRKEDFAEALVLHYNKIRKGMLRTDFSHGSHPGHHEDPDNKERWIVALDDAIGFLDLENPMPEGCTYSTTLCGVTISTGLIIIQIPLKLSRPS